MKYEIRSNDGSAEMARYAARGKDLLDNQPTTWLGSWVWAWKMERWVRRGIQAGWEIEVRTSSGKSVTYTPEEYTGLAALPIWLP